MEKYVIVTWPESQWFMGMDDVHLIDADKYPEYGPAAYLVPEEEAEKFFNKILD